ncbi:TetR/AcrR family transcriptional regulator [Streptomyces shenzhenensis]|uniref:TetR/AcrR family transcriptional regulator n=1 Tax=Streptomyces shenzhenensis TaxID=943815 RepID=UPI003D93E4C5
MARPKTPLLSATRIADGALELVESTGDVQMIQLARHLGVAPSSLYTHVAGRAEVIDLARLRMLEQMEPIGPVHDWREAVASLLRQLTALYARHRRILPLIFATTLANDRSLAVYEPMFAALIQDGFRPDQLRLVVAVVEFQAFGLAQGLPAPAMSEHIRETFPAYTASVDHSRYDLATATEFSVAMVIGGLEALRARPVGP